jgi:nitroreductase
MTRRFLPDPIDPVLLDEILDLARRAPSAGYSQGTHFVVLTGAALHDFWSRTGADEWFGGSQPGVLAAPVVVIPVADPAAYTSRYAEADKAGHGLHDPAAWPVPYWLTDTAMAVQNLLLLVEERRLGALYFGIFRNGAQYLRSIGVPDGLVAIGAVAIGRRDPEDVPSGSPRSRGRRAASEVIHHGRW